MLRTVTQQCQLPIEEANALNHESGRIYSQILVTHWRVFRHTGHWLSDKGAEQLNDWYRQGEARLLHAHSIDAAQQGFYKACKTARTNKKEGLYDIRFPYKRKWYRTTVWKSSGIRQQRDHLLLSRARGCEPIRIEFDTEAEVREVRLVYDIQQHGYLWHIVIEDHLKSVPVENGCTAAVDLGEVHPVAITDGEEVCILSCRQLRSVAQQTNKELANLQQKLSQCKKGSRRDKRLRRAKRKMLARQKRRRRDLEHKVSRAAVNWCQERNVGTLAIGDVRKVADKTAEMRRLNRETRQKVSNWSHGTVRKYLTYKAQAAGITVDDKVPEHYTSQTCLQCGERNKPKGRNYRCRKPDCLFSFPRDGVGCANILSRKVYGELGQIVPKTVKYRRSFQRWSGLRSPDDTRHVANVS